MCIFVRWRCWRWKDRMIRHIKRHAFPPDEIWRNELPYVAMPFGRSYFIWSWANWAGHHPQVHHQFRGTSQAWRMDRMLEEGEWRASNCCFDGCPKHAFPGGMPRISSCQPRLCTLEGGRWNDETVRLNGTCHIMLTCFTMFQYL